MPARSPFFAASSWVLSLGAVLALTGTTGCVTTGKKTGGSTKPLAEKTEDKNGTKTVAGTTTPQAVTGTQNTTTAAVRVPTVDEQLAFLRVHSSPAAPFGDADHQFVAALPQAPTSGTIAEAALALGVVKSVLHPLNVERSTFKEADIAAASGSATTAGGTGGLLSLESQCRERGVNLADALVENPLLGSYGVARQVLQALDQGQNSQEYRTEIMVALRRQASLWSELANTMPADGALGAAVEPVDTTVGAAAPIDDSEPPNPADLAGGDAALAEAQALADRGEFQSAIKKAMAVGEGPLKPAATEKVREFSNLAVQDLRRKAAQAFQSAMPVTDAKKRAEYLRQAKTFLEEAIKNFPDATQLPTVRDNLRVISRDLEKLDAEVSKGH